MIPDVVWLLGPAAIAISAYAYGYHTGHCSRKNPCEKCGYHVNEKRMTEAANRERAHDERHRGAGYATTGQDIYACGDKGCPRNPKPKV